MRLPLLPAPALALALSLVLPALPALAEDSPLDLLETADDLRGWEAVGWIDMGGSGLCTGTLIAPDLVLTAAHCLFVGQSPDRIDPETIRFMAGWRNGRALAERTIRRAIAHPGYVHGPDGGAQKSYNDVALLVLDQPIRTSRIEPIPVGPMMPLGQDLGIVSYAHDRTDAPALQESCSVIGAETRLVVLSCNVDFGSSGAPLFRMGEDGPQIVSVVSAKAEHDGRPVAVGVWVEEPIALLRAMAEEGDGPFRDGAPPGARVLASGERAETGARFVRP